MQCLYYIYRNDNDCVVCTTKILSDSSELIIIGSKPKTLNHHSRQLISNDFLLSEAINSFQDLDEKVQTNKSKGKRLSGQDLEILKQRALIQHNNGKSLREIAASLNISKSTVFRLLKTS